MLRAVICAAEAGVARLPLARARELSEGSVAGRAVLALKLDRERRLALGGFASSLLLLASGLMGGLAPQEGSPWLPVAAGASAVAVAAGLELLFRALAQGKPERWAMLWAPLARLVTGPLAPIWNLSVGLVGRLTRPFGGGRPEVAEPMPTLEEVEAHLSAEAAQGRVGKADPELLRSLLDFSEKTAREVMIPRTQVVGLEISAPVAEIVRVISEEGHTRVPIYRETLDEIVGILHARDLVPLLTNPELIRLPDLIRPVFFVPWAKRIGAVLREMQRRRDHIAAVVDEYGGVMGVITLEDILAEIVGELGGDSSAADEGPAVERLADGSALVRASISREEFNDAFSVELPGDDAETLAGWLNQRAGAIPELGERFLVDGLMLQVVERSPSRVRRVKVAPRKAKGAEPSGIAKSA
jgi:putative hemolysin